MKPYLNVKFADGYIYQIPTIVVAKDRANHYHTNRPEEFPTFDDALKDSTALFKNYEFEIEDWAKNNMNWSELDDHARMVGFEPAERVWTDAEISFADERTEMPPPNNGENLLYTPMIYALGRLGAADGLCSIINIMDPKGQVAAAVAFMRGGPQAVEYYTSGLTRLTEIAEEVMSSGTDKPAQH